MASVASTGQASALAEVNTVAWALGAGDTGKAVSMANFPDKTVQVTGTFGSVTLRGSNKAAPDDTVSGDWFNLTDLQGNALTFTSAGGKLIAENTLWISPITAGGSGYSVMVTGVKE